MSLSVAEHLPVLAEKRNWDNGHAKSGSCRDTARRAIAQAVGASGFRHYEINPAVQSPAEKRDHPHVATNDLDSSFACDEVEDGDVVVGIDVDYYVADWSKYLGSGNPFIFYTFSPVRVAGSDGDCRFRIKGNQVHYEVSGGGSWVHSVWDWTAFGEFIMTPALRYRGWELAAWLLGFQKQAVHKVMFTRPWKDCPGRAVVWGLPQHRFWTHRLLPDLLHVRRLGRVKYEDNRNSGWNSLVTLGPDGTPVVSLGREGEDAEVTLPKTHLDVLLGLGSAQSVTTRCIGLGIKETERLALIGQYYSKAEKSNCDPARLSNPAQACVVHWPIGSLADKPETSFRTYAPPAVSDQFMVPMIKRWETITKSLDFRVAAVTNTRVPSQRYQALAAEFVELVVPLGNTGVPFDWEDARDLLDKPSQALMVRNVWETVDAAPRQLIEAFVKNEPTNKPGRIISAFPDMRWLLGFSRFTLKFRDEVLHAEHNQHWFCPGLNPHEIAAKVCEFVSTVEEPMEGDFSNFDGTVSWWCHQYVMNAVYHRYFGVEYREELRRYTNSLVSCPSRTKRFGFRYDSGPGVKSGSPTTCDLNSVLNAFVQYAAVRISMPYLDKETAFRSIGLAFGDDSLFRWDCAPGMNKVANALGLRLKCERYRCEQGITFLSRVFPDPYRTTTTFQDPIRTLRKLHMTSRNPSVPLADAAVDRVTGYLVTDDMTPMVGSYCRKVRDLYSPQVTVNAGLRACRNREKPYWATADGSWPQSVSDAQLVREVFAARTGFSLERIDHFEAQVTSASTVWDLPTINRDEEPNPYAETVLPDGAVESVDDRHILETKENFSAALGVLVSARDGKPAVPAQHSGERADGPEERSRGPDDQSNRTGHHGPAADPARPNKPASVRPVHHGEGGSGVGQRSHQADVSGLAGRPGDRAENLRPLRPRGRGNATRNSRPTGGRGRGKRGC